MVFLVLKEKKHTHVFHGLFLLVRQNLLIRFLVLRINCLSIIQHHKSTTNTRNKSTIKKVFFKNRMLSFFR